MNDSPVHLVICATCSAHPAATEYATEVPQPGPFYCPKCRLGLVSAEEQLAAPDPVVGLVDARPEARWCVTEILGGGFFLARPLGLPSFPARKMHVSEVRPAFSYRRLELARRR